MFTFSRKAGFDLSFSLELSHNNSILFNLTIKKFTCDLNKLRIKEKKIGEN